MAGLPNLGSNLALLAVWSNIERSSARIVYRHDPTIDTMDINFFLGEIEIVDGTWGFPGAIQVGPGLIPNNVALTHDLTRSDKGRTLFFGQINDDNNQDLLVMHYDADKFSWSEATQIVDRKSAQPIQARKESHFAATQIPSPIGPSLALYFLDENSNVMEVVGTKSAIGYDWHVGDIVARSILPKSRLAAISYRKTRHVVFQESSGKLAVATHSGKEWSVSEIPSLPDLEKGSALALSSSGGNGLTYYFTKAGKIYAHALQTPPPESAHARTLGL